MPDDAPPPVVSVLAADDGPDGEKGAFGRARDRALQATALSSDTFAEGVRAMCDYVGRAFAEGDRASGGLRLDVVEVTVEVTTKGELRLIGAASAEVKGGIKLQFRRG